MPRVNTKNISPAQLAEMHWVDPRGGSVNAEMLPDIKMAAMMLNCKPSELRKISLKELLETTN